MKRNTRKFRLVLTTLMLVALVFSVFGAVPTQANGDDPNTVASSTMVFEGTLTDNGDGTYTGTIPMIDETVNHLGDDEAGFDVYAQEGGCAYVEGYYGGPDASSCGYPPGDVDTYVVGYYGNAHDAYTSGGPWGTWYDPDCADYNCYHLELAANHWYLVYDCSPPPDNHDISPMSGTMDWGNMYAAETDTGGNDGTGHGGTAAHGGGAAAWDYDWGWGVEVIPLQLPGFDVEITGLGGDQYRVTLTPAAYEVWVDDSYSASYCPAGTIWETTCFDNITDALTGVHAGGTIYVGSGTYDEALNITKNVTLIGYGGPVITGGAVTTVHDIIKVDGDYTVNIKGFTLDRVTASSASPNTGIYYLHGASGTIEGNTIRHIEGNRGYGILLGGGLGGTACDDNADIGVGTVTVRNNTTGGTTAATAIGRVGIEVKCPSSGTVIVEDNEVIGSYDAIPFLSYGITAYGGADPIIRNNNVHHHTHPVDMWGSGGMACGDYGVTGNGCDATIENNYIHDNETGIYVGTLYYSGTYDYSSPTIKYNRIEGSEWGINIEGGASPNITNNTITGASGVGIDIGDYNGTANSGASSSVQNNTFSGLDSAVVISDTGTGGTTYTFTSNDFAGNTVGFTNNYTFTTDINAENNWWGATTGPATGYITGTQASKVDYAPWSEALMGGVAASTHAVGETSTFDVKVTADDVYGVQFIVDYDTAPIDYSAHTKTDNPFFWDYVVWDGSRNDGAGTVKFSGSHQLDSHPNPADLTNNEVADVTFECKFQGTSSITFDQARLSDIDGYEIPSTWVGDSVVCTAEEHTVTGQMKLQSRYSGSYDGTVEAFVPGGYTDTSAGDGSFSITVPDGIGYTVSFEMPRFLDHVVTGLTISGDYDFGTIGLRGGDTNDDDIINIQDLSTIGGVFGTSPGTGSNADINYDGDVNILDLAVAGGNFGRTSPVLW